MQYVDVNGIRVPALGFGTFLLKPADTYRMVRYALETGYRHIDTAQMYRNEADVGRAIADSGVPREEIFLTTKVWPEHFHASDLERSVDESLERLDVDYVDLLLLHWPNPEVPLRETVKALMGAKGVGKTRHIGVSNFTTRLVQETVAICGHGELLTNQVEYHVFLTQRSLLQQARELAFPLTAYCPLAQGRTAKDATLQAIGERHGKSGPQVALRWLLDQNVIALPRTTNEKHADANFDVFDFELSDEDRRLIDEKLQGDGRVVNPASLAPEWDRP